MKRGLALFAMIVLATIPCCAGTKYTFTTLTEADGARSATRTHVWAAGGSLKMLFVQSDEPTTPVSSYLLRPTARTSALYLVYPEKKSYVRWDPSQALQPASSRLEVLSPRFEKVSEEPGGKVAGFSTTHYLFRLTYTMRSELFGHTVDTPVTVEQEYWVANDPRLADIKAANLMRSQTAGLSQFGPELQRTIAEQTDKLRGTPLKTIMRFVMRLPAREQETMMTSEISDVRTVAIPPATFRLPPGYRKVKATVAEAEDDVHAH